MSLKLSEAIRLGSLLVENPGAGVINGCAIKMASLAIGKVSESDCWLSTYTQVKNAWPWLAEIAVSCPVCSEPLPLLDPGFDETSIIHHVFDYHVLDRMMTIEQLADWIATIEPEDGVVMTEPMENVSEVTQCR